MNEKKGKSIQKRMLFLTCLTIFLFLLLSLLSFQILSTYQRKESFEKQALFFAESNENIIFSVDQITFFSSSDCKNKASSETNFTLENLYTYTDIAFFIHNHATEYTSENTLKDLKINHLKVITRPTLGNPNLYYRNLNQFTKSDLESNYPLAPELNFTIISEDTADLSTPTLYNNCANPITLRYQNENIKTDYTLTDTSIPLTYDGSLLKRCGISLESISCFLSFDLLLTNQKDQKFKTTVSFEIPYENSQTSIYEGSILVKQDTAFNFYRYQ